MSTSRGGRSGAWPSGSEEAWHPGGVLVLERHRLARGGDLDFAARGRPGGLDGQLESDIIIGGG